MTRLMHAHYHRLAEHETGHRILIREKGSKPDPRAIIGFATYDFDDGTQAAEVCIIDHDGTVVPVSQLDPEIEILGILDAGETTKREARRKLLRKAATAIFRLGQQFV